MNRSSICVKLDKQVYSATCTLALAVVKSVGFTHLCASVMRKHLFCELLLAYIWITEVFRVQKVQTDCKHAEDPVVERAGHPG